tara:strand:- start:1268 stop:1471 length:204 start_codon:yes stop_codon:yes gene_type:complete
MKVTITPKITASVDMNLDQISTILYILEGYMDGNDDSQICDYIDNELIPILESASNNIPLPDDDPFW